MTDRDAHLAAILAAPDDDLLRLSYADRLTEEGEGDRAEFIRVQVELHGIPKSPVESLEMAKHVQGLQSREWQLMSSMALEFGGEQDSWMVIPRRGFIEQFRGTVGDWLQRADAITSLHPITHVTFTTRIDWEMRNYDAYLFDRADRENRSAHRLCKPMEPDHIEEALRTGISVVLKHEWPGVKTWEFAPEPVAPQQGDAGFAEYIAGLREEIFTGIMGRRTSGIDGFNSIPSVSWNADPATATPIADLRRFQETALRNSGQTFQEIAEAQAEQRRSHFEEVDRRLRSGELSVEDAARVLDTPGPNPFGVSDLRAAYRARNVMTQAMIDRIRRETGIEPPA